MIESGEQQATVNGFQRRVSNLWYFSNHYRVLALLAVSYLPMAASAQGLAPSLPEPPAQASEIERRQEHELEAQRARAAERPDILSQPPSGGVGQPLQLPTETPCFTLSALTWAGEQPPADLLRTMQSVVGLCVGAQGLRALHTYLMGQLIEAGLITSHVVIPEQSLATGQLSLR